MEAKEVSTLITHPIDSDKYKHSQNCSWIVYADRPGITTSQGVHGHQWLCGGQF